nr:hypothetical protein [Ningiella ruwaisensis]
MASATSTPATDAKKKAKVSSKVSEEINKRRTFAIISHPDAAQPFNA